MTDPTIIATDEMTKQREIDKENIRELVPETDPILKSPLAKFDFSNPPIDPVKLAEILYDNMMFHGGIGLAANQIGLPYRAFIMRGTPCVVVFNGRIVDTSERTISIEEGCLTYPDLFMKITRPEIIKVRFQDPTGEMQNVKYSGMTARIFQHENDHMEGLDCFRLASAFHKQKALKDRKLIQRRRKRHSRAEYNEGLRDAARAKKEVLTIDTGSAIYR